MAPARGGFKNSTAFTTAGAHTFTVPAGVFLMEVAIWGAGGGGGSGGGGGGGAFYINDGSYYGDALGTDGSNGNNHPNAGGTTTATRDTNSFAYSAPGGAGGYGGTYGARGGNNSTGAAYLNNHDLNSPNHPSPFGVGATSVGSGASGNWATGPDGQAGTDALNTFDESASNYADMAKAGSRSAPDGYTEGYGGAAAAISYEGHAYGKGGIGGDGGKGGNGYYGGDDTTDQGSPGAPGGGGSSGGGGGLSIHTLSVSPGETFTIQVGAGGAQVSGGAGGLKAQDPIQIGGLKQDDGLPGGVGAKGQDGAVVFRY